MPPMYKWVPAGQDLPGHSLRGNLQPGEGCGRSSVKRYASSLPVLSVPETSKTQWIQKAAAIDLLIQWHESDLTVDHYSTPVAIKDFMHVPGASTLYEELDQFKTEQFELAQFTRVFDQYTGNSVCTIAEIGGHLFIVFDTTPETISMDDSDIDIIYIKTTINTNLQDTPFAIKPDPDEDLEDPLQSIIPNACEVIHLDDDDEDEELAPDAAPVDNDEPPLLRINTIATPSTPDIPPIETVDVIRKMQFPPWPGTHLPGSSLGLGRLPNPPVSFYYAPTRFRQLPVHL
ncbi:hypothetical protein BDD12DRAFT_904638 [Trichophaea hybrida]|nr:hypothetical protein BDD12DRAFT_904638 [Trichophaea hybrida]